MKRITNIIFMGTPQFAVPTLKSLIKNKIAPKLVITQPDRGRGRGRKKSFSPVKKVAVKNDLRILQPQKLNSESTRKIIREINPDLIVTAAYGKILGSKILSIPRFGCINLHPSLLPKYRGPSPINWSLFKGDNLTGNTVYFMDKKMDAGDIILQQKLEILPEDNYGSLQKKLSDRGAEIILKAIAQIDTGRATGTPQDHSTASYTHLLDNSIRRIEWNNSALKIKNLIKGLAPYPAAFTTLGGKNFKIIKAQVVDNSKENPGTILEVQKNMGFVVSTGSQGLLITQIKPPGKKSMSAYSYSLGHNLIGKKFDAK